jgi:XTP/dITP diphosphohydrolase
MSRQLLLATRNVEKLAELRRILAAADVDVELVGIDAVPDAPEVEETGTSFSANALLKARTLAEFSGLPTIAEDSGLCVDSLNGMPGILSARWSGSHGDDEANLRLLLAQLDEVSDERRNAHFVCAAAVVVPDAEGAVLAERVADGTMEGCITRKPRGEGGFGYDPVFRPYGESRTTAEMSAPDKDAISHRGKALRALVPMLREVLT